jgi:hypothetical protein
MNFALGIFCQSIFWTKSPSTIALMNSQVGAPMSHWPVAPPWSRVSSSSFEAYVS